MGVFSAEVEIDASDLSRVATRMAENADIVAREIPALLATWEVQDLNRRAPGVQVNGETASTFLWNWTPEQRKAFYKLMKDRGEFRRKRTVVGGQVQRGRRAPRRRRGEKRPVLRPHLFDALRVRVDAYLKSVPIW